MSTENNKRKFNQITDSDKNTEVSMSLFDILNLDADESNMSNTELAPALSDSATCELFKTLGVQQLHFAHDLYDSSQGFPGGLKTSNQYNLLVVVFPRRDDRIFTAEALKGADGRTDGTKWGNFMNYRTTRGPTKMSDGNSTKNTFAWMELALYIPTDFVPPESSTLHQEALSSLADESEGKFATLSGSSFFIRARVCKPFTVNFMNMVQSDTYCSMLDKKELPVVLLKNFIVQKLPGNGGYVFSSQSAGHKTSSVHLVGSIQRDATFAPIGCGTTQAVIDN